MKKVLTFALTTAILFSLSLPALAFSDPYYTVPLIYETTTMPDLPQTSITVPDPFTDCHDELIISAWACGIIDGSGNGQFRPLDTLTKAEWAQMLFNAFAPHPREPRPAGQPWYTQAADWLGLDSADFNSSASYQWCIETAYQLWCRGGEIKFVATDATAWALGYGAGISDSWRNLSNMGAASGQFFTRTEAVALLIRLGELDLRPLG